LEILNFLIGHFLTGVIEVKKLKKIVFAGMLAVELFGAIWSFYVF